MNMSPLSLHSEKVLGLFRIIAGLLFMQHGLQKLFGYPVAFTMPIQIMSQLGIGGILELVGGTLIVLGLCTRPVGFVLSGMMAVAYFQFHWQFGAASPFPVVNKGELAIMFSWFFLYLVFAGPGAWALDNMLARRTPPLLRQTLPRGADPGEGFIPSARRSWRSSRR